MKNSIYIFLLLFAVNTLALTEQEFIEKVINQDENFEKDQIYVTIKQLELETSKASYANWNATLGALLSSSYYDIEKDTTSTKVYEKHRLKNTQAIGIGVGKRFLSNPSSLTFKATRSIPDTDITRYKKDEIYTGKNAEYNVTTFDNVYSVNYKYPLLKHDSNASGLKTYHRDILDLEREKFDFNDAQEKFLVGRLRQYIDWNFYQKNAEIYQDYKSMLKAIKVNEAKDKSKLNTAILLVNQDILSNDSKLQSLKKVLVSMLNDSSLWTENPEINTNKRPKIIHNLTQYLQHNVRTLLKIEIDRRLKKIDLDYHNNQSLYKLDFNISAEINDNKGNTMTTDYKSKSVLYTAGLNFSMPIGTDVNNKKDIHVAQLNLRKLNIDYSNKLKDILSDAQALIVKLRLAKKSLNEYQKLIANVNNESNLAHTSYLGKSITITDLIDAYKEKFDVELGYIKALTGYQKSLLKYNDKLDRVLPKFNVIPR
ncbi:hypothetical protein [uncultured Gammaproteobacteria bacterium]|jgi:hypothetical protein|nr:hypothetical protein [uncultured Gammaproteobacteria bacterium]CAC9981295.1 hypothetical protein [uncultured Gammaproteobacteria bacterium]